MLGPSVLLAKRKCGLTSNTHPSKDNTRHDISFDFKGSPKNKYP